MLKKLRTIFTKLFLKNNFTKWADSINSIINHHNKSEHSSLDGISPNDATTKKHYEHILDINVNKNIKNKIVSDLEVGDHVRKNLLYNNIFAKTTDQKWSGKVFKVVKVVGRSITLDDDSTFKRENLLKVSKESKDYKDDPVGETKRITKELDG